MFGTLRNETREVCGILFGPRDISTLGIEIEEAEEVEDIGEDNYIVEEKRSKGEETWKVNGRWKMLGIDR